MNYNSGMNNSFRLASISDLKNPVNQWICIAFMGVLCFWVVLYYFVNRTQAVGNTLLQSPSMTSIENLRASPSR